MATHNDPSPDSAKDTSAKDEAKVQIPLPSGADPSSLDPKLFRRNGVYDSPEYDHRLLSAIAERLRMFASGDCIADVVGHDPKVRLADAGQTPGTFSNISNDGKSSTHRELLAFADYPRSDEYKSILEAAFPGATIPPSLVAQLGLTEEFVRQSREQRSYSLYDQEPGHEPSKNVNDRDGDRKFDHAPVVPSACGSSYSPLVTALVDNEVSSKPVNASDPSIASARAAIDNDGEQYAREFMKRFVKAQENFTVDPHSNELRFRTAPADDSVTAALTDPSYNPKDAPGVQIAAGKIDPALAMLQEVAKGTKELDPHAWDGKVTRTGDQRVARSAETRNLTDIREAMVKEFAGKQDVGEGALEILKKQPERLIALGLNFTSDESREETTGRVRRAADELGARLAGLGYRVDLDGAAKKGMVVQTLGGGTAVEPTFSLQKIATQTAISPTEREANLRRVISATLSNQYGPDAAKDLTLMLRSDAALSKALGLSVPDSIKPAKLARMLSVGETGFSSYENATEGVIRLYQDTHKLPSTGTINAATLKAVGSEQ